VTSIGRLQRFVKQQILFSHSVYVGDQMISWDYPFIINDSWFRLSLLVYVADKYVNDQIHLYHDPSSFSLPLYTALTYATGLL